MSGEQRLQELVTGMVMSLAHPNRQIDEVTSRQAEALRDDVKSIKREILPAHSLRFDEFQNSRILGTELISGDPSP